MKRDRKMSSVESIAREIVQKCFSRRPKPCTPSVAYLEQLDPRMLLSVPPTPLDLVSVNQGSGEIDLSWDASETATGYYVYRGTDVGAESQTPLNDTPLTATAFNDTTVGTGSHYYYTVKAVNGDGSSDASYEADAWTSPAAPINIWGTNYGTNLLYMTWGESYPNTVTGYNVYRGTSPGGESSTPLNTSTLTDSYWIGWNETPGSQYYYFVTAYNLGGMSAPSSEISITMAPDAPTGLTATASGANQVDLSWTAPSGSIIGYNGGFNFEMPH